MKAETNINTKVTIISPTYNHGSFIADCIRSAQSQTFTNWEMIVIDDGSKDSTPDIVTQFAAEDSRIRLIRQENVGIFRLSETYNRALEMSTGEYITILEGDDYWAADKLERQVAALESNQKAVLCWSQAYSVVEGSTESREIYPVAGSVEEKYFHNDPPGSILNVFLFRNCIPALTIMTRKEILVRLGGFRQNCGLPLVDLPTLYELALQGSFLFIPVPLGFWRNYPTQITKTYTAKMMEGCRCLARSYFDRAVQTGMLEHTLTRKKLERFYDEQLIVSYSRSGRYKLIRREFAGARKDYLRSIFRYGYHQPLWKLRSVTGLVFSLFRLDVEGLSRLLGKKSYK